MSTKLWLIRGSVPGVVCRWSGGDTLCGVLDRGELPSDEPRGVVTGRPAGHSVCLACERALRDGGVQAEPPRRKRAPKLHVGGSC